MSSFDSFALNLQPRNESRPDTTVRVFFNWLEREEYIKQTPFNKSVKFTSKHKKDKDLKVLESEQIARIFATLTQSARLETFNGCRDLALISFLIDSGVRLGELLSIRYCDLDLTHNRCIVNGKTGKRKVVFSEKCREFLQKYLKHPKNLHKSQDPKSDSSPIWRTSDNLPLSFSGAESLVTRLRESSGVKFHPHQLRHTFATMLANQGVSAFDLKELLGHSTITTTQIYVNSNVERLADIHRPHFPLNSIMDPGIRT